MSSEAPLCVHCGQPDPFADKQDVFAAEAISEVRALKRAGDITNAIRRIRELMPGLPLEDAKEFLDDPWCYHAPAIAAIFRKNLSGA